MDSRTAIFRCLPYLRRYARALMGSQSQGDACVRECLETYLDRLDTEVDADHKLNLFRTVASVCGRRLHVQRGTSDRVSGIETKPLERWLAELAPVERQVLLLVSLEEFSVEETGLILGMGSQEVTSLLAAARYAIRRRIAAPVLIIEDDPIIAMNLSNIVQRMGHKICGTTALQEEAVRLAQQTPPALVLADVELGRGGSGIEAVRKIVRRTRSSVIFVTAYPERLVLDDPARSEMVLSKPFATETVEKAIGRALLLYPERPSVPADSA